MNRFPWTWTWTWKWRLRRDHHRHPHPQLLRIYLLRWIPLFRKFRTRSVWRSIPRRLTNQLFPNAAVRLMQPTTSTWESWRMKGSHSHQHVHHAIQMLPASHVPLWAYLRLYTEESVTVLGSWQAFLSADTAMTVTRKTPGFRGLFPRLVASFKPETLFQPPKHDYGANRRNASAKKMRKHGARMTRSRPRRARKYSA